MSTNLYLSAFLLLQWSGAPDSRATIFGLTKDPPGGFPQMSNFSLQVSAEMQGWGHRWWPTEGSFCEAFEKGLPRLVPPRVETLLAGRML